MKKIGVLALQGSFSLHRPHIEVLGGQYSEVRHQKDLELLDGLILPGGESSVMLRLLKEKKLLGALEQYALEKPLWGICAGAILLAQSVISPEQSSLSLIPMEVTRNSYGSQLASFEKEIGGAQVSFIRAPKINHYSKDVQVEHYLGEQAVSVLYKKRRASTFHPELSLKYPSPFHEAFVRDC